jgi:hypothetical protein
MMRKTMIEVGVACANALMFIVALLVGYWFVFPILHGVLGLGRVAPGFEPALSWYQGVVMSLCLAFAIFGGVARRWTRHILNVAIVSACIFLLGMIALAQAMYLTDRGDPSIMWAYIRPRQAQYVGTLCASVAAALGWTVGEILHRYRSATE